MRGIFPASLPFPLTKEEAERATETSLKDLAVRTFNSITDWSTVKDQRQRAFKDAFYSLDRALLKRLQSAVQKDCDMFMYDCDVDLIFKESEKPANFMFHL